MRGRQALKNMSASLILQIIVFLSGIILPRFFLEAYGSQINGLVTSINQFLVYLGLAEAGIGTASVVALYTPLAEKDDKKINSILSASRSYYSKIGWSYLILLALLAVVFPMLIEKQLPASLVRWMVFILGSSMFINLYFSGKYKVYLTAKQEGYVLAIIETVGTLLTMIISIVLIYCKFDVIAVKSVATIVVVFRFFFVKHYMNRRYSELDYYAEPDYQSLNQRGAALLHQVVGIIVNNTDVVLLTVMLGAKSLLEVSVYGIYNMVVYAINMLMNSFSNGLTAGFGEVVSKKEEEVLKKSFQSYEYLYFIVFFTITICLAVLLVPFVCVYTMNISDVNYIRPITAMLFVLILFLQNVRMPGMTIICAAGHFKQTRRQAITEAIINVVVSLALIKPLGMNGVLIGTICSYGYRSFEIIWYNQKYLVPETGKTTMLRLVRNLVASVIISMACLQFVPQNMLSFVTWFIYACVTGVIAGTVLSLVNYVVEPESFKELIYRVKAVVKK